MSPAASGVSPECHASLISSAIPTFRTSSATQRAGLASQSAKRAPFVTPEPAAVCIKQILTRVASLIPLLSSYVAEGRCWANTCAQSRAAATSDSAANWGLTTRRSPPVRRYSVSVSFAVSVSVSYLPVCLSFSHSLSLCPRASSAQERALSFSLSSSLSLPIPFPLSLSLPLSI